MTPGSEFDHLNFMREIAAESPENLELSVQLGRQLLSSGQYRAAIDMLTELDRRHPNEPMVWALLAAGHIQMEHTPTAELYLRRVVASEAPFPRLHLALGLLLADRGAEEEALNVFLKAHRKFPRDKSLHHELVVIHLRFDRHEDARSFAETLIKQYPADSETQRLWSRVLIQTEEYEQAERALLKYLADHAGDSDALNDLAWVIGRTPSRRSEAIDIAERVVSMSPENGNAWETRHPVPTKR